MVLFPGSELQSRSHPRFALIAHRLALRTQAEGFRAKRGVCFAAEPCSLRHKDHKTEVTSRVSSFVAFPCPDPACELGLVVLGNPADHEW